MTKKIIFVLAVVVVAVVVWQGKPEAQPQPTELDTTGWVTFRSEKYGFEIKHPQGWQVESFTQSIVLKSFLGSTLEIIEQKNEENLPLDDWFRNVSIIDGRPTIKASAKPIIIDDRTAYKLDSDLDPPNPLFEVYIADDQRKVFLFSATSQDKSDTQILETVLFMLKFLSQ